MMKTRAAEIVPAAVISIGNIRGSAIGGEEDALVAGDRRHRRERIHALRPRDARHQLHREQRVRRVAANSRIASGAPSGSAKPMTTWPVRSGPRGRRARGPGEGCRRSGRPRSAVTIDAPCSRYAASVNPAAAPAPVRRRRRGRLFSARPRRRESERHASRRGQSLCGTPTLMAGESSRSSGHVLRAAAVVFCGAFRRAASQSAMATRHIRADRAFPAASSTR